MAASHYSRHVQFMVAHAGQRIADINWLFTSVDASLRVAQKRLNEDERKRAMVSLQREKFVQLSAKVSGRSARSKTGQALG